MVTSECVSVSRSLWICKAGSKHTWNHLNQVSQSFLLKDISTAVSSFWGNSSSIHSSVPIPNGDELAKRSMRFQTIGLHDQLWSSSTHRLPLPCSIIPESKWFTMGITWNKWIINPWDQWHRVSEADINRAGDDVTKRQEFQWNVPVREGGNGNFKQPSCQLVPCKLSGNTGLVL